MTPTDLASAGAEMLSLPDALTRPEAPRLPDSLLRARAAVEAAVADYLAIPDERLLEVWLFRGVDPEDGVRYGIYRGAETIDAADAELEAALAGTRARAPGSIRSASATLARWALHGRLAALDDSLLDRVPRPGEWTVRETMGHIIGGQRGYGWFTRWWVLQPIGAGRPARVTAEADAEAERLLPSDEAEAKGTVADIRARLDSVLDEWARRFADIDATALALPAAWSGVPVDVDFRVGRWASHIREHTIQIDKTLDWLGVEPSEPARIVRDLYAAWGRLEAQIFPVAPAGSEAAIASILDRCSSQLVSDARSAREAAKV